MTDEERFRAIVAARPYLGDWDEWARIAYDKIPVMPRMVLSHVYGRHDDSPLAYAHCVLCSYFRPDLPDGERITDANGDELEHGTDTEAGP